MQQNFKAEIEFRYFRIQKPTNALAGVAQWIEHQPVNQRVTGLIPSQGTFLGCGTGPQVGACEKQPFDTFLAYQCFSPSLFYSLSLSLKVNI